VRCSLHKLVLRHVLQTVTIYAKNIARWAGIAGPVKHIGNQFHPPDLHPVKDTKTIDARNTQLVTPVQAEIFNHVYNAF
jgi:hypothetical protein